MLACGWPALSAHDQPASADGRESDLAIDRATRSGRFFDVVGRRAALLGFENRTVEAWVYPVEILDRLALSFQLEGDPREIAGSDIMSTIQVRPEATTLVYTHAAFTVRETMFAPIDEAGAVLLLDVDPVLPVSIAVSFRPRLRLMWPATSTTPSVSWNAGAHAYTIVDESGRFAGAIGSPAARDPSPAPPEQPREGPNRFVLNASAHARLPIAMAGSTDGLDAALASYRRLVGSPDAWYRATSAHYADLDARTLTVVTPDERLNAAFRWAKVGIDKGLATDPLLGTGLIAGFGAAGDGERPGYAWFFGRDALWTALATTAEGAFETTRTALEFLRRFQRDDGKIPHEIAQTATLVPWFDRYPYPWASADATPLYVVAQADYFRAAGDRAFLERAWPSIVKAYRFSAATDSDANGLIDNTNVGHGWVEGGALYPAHEEIYLQGLWIAASQAVGSLARVVGDPDLANAASAAADRTRAAMEATYWNERGGFYEFATRRPGTERTVAEPGPNRERRQARLDELGRARRIDEDTVLPAVPLWFGTARADRADRELDHLGSGAIATDWGARILSNRSRLYDPLAYHYGSVWPLFTGWSAVAAYRYGRPHVGYQALMANALLTWAGALGDATELLSGDFATEFDRSSHHQVWSDAMIVAPTIRGLLGIEVDDAGRTIRFAPSLPASWDRVEARGLAAAGGTFDLAFTHKPGTITMRVSPQRVAGARAPARAQTIELAPALPLDARVLRVTLGGRPVSPEIRPEGDVEVVRVVASAAAAAEAVFTIDEGTDVYTDVDAPGPGARSEGIRLLRSRADAGALHLLVEGLGGRTYALHLRSPHRPGAADGVTVRSEASGRVLEIRFDGTAGEYVRRDITIPLLP